MPRPIATGQWSLKRRPRRKTWHAYRRVNGIAEWKSLSTEDEREARQALADLENETDELLGQPTIADVLTGYLNERKGKVEDHARLFWASERLSELLGELRPDQLTDARWQQYCDDRGVSAGTLRRERNVLVAAFNLSGVGVPTLKPPPKPAGRPYYLTRDQADAVIAELKSPHQKLFVRILLSTGCRPGACLDLTWDRVDFANRRIDFRVPGKPIHNKRRAIIFMGDKVMEMLRDAFVARKENDSGYVIEWGRKPVKDVGAAFGRAVARAGLNPRQITPHVLRHTAVSWMAMGGVKRDDAARMMACDPATLRSTYEHFDPGYLADDVAVLEG